MAKGCIRSQILFLQRAECNTEIFDIHLSHVKGYSNVNPRKTFCEITFSHIVAGFWLDVKNLVEETMPISSFYSKAASAVPAFLLMLSEPSLCDLQ